MRKQILALFPLMIALGLPGQAQAQDCAEWGEVDPTEVDAHLDEIWTFRVIGATQNCGDASQCSWWLDETEGLGSLSQGSGSPIDWTAPPSLADCIETSFKLNLACPDLDEQGETSDYATITLSCTGDDKAALRYDQGSTTVGGGGCTSPQTAAALLILPLFGLRRRRRRRRRRREQ